MLHDQILNCVKHFFISILCDCFKLNATGFPTRPIKYELGLLWLTIAANVVSVIISHRIKWSYIAHFLSWMLNSSMRRQWSFTILDSVKKVVPRNGRKRENVLFAQFRIEMTAWLDRLKLTKSRYKVRLS